MKLDIQTLEIQRNKLNISIREHRMGSKINKNIQKLISDRNRITKQLSVLYYRDKSE